MIIPFFTTGTHTDSAGNTHTITGEELDRRARLYNEQRQHEAPVVVGHPQTDAPAYGWIERVRRDGNTLVAEVRDVQPEFAEALARKLWKKVSAAFYPDGLLRHVGFLGAQPPAIKGLPSFQFAAPAGETTEFEFSEPLSDRERWMWNSVRRILSGLRDHLLVTEKDEQKVNAIIAPWDLEALIPPTETPAVNSYNEPHKGASMPPTTPSVEELQTQLADAQSKHEAATARIQQLEAQFAEQRTAAARDRIAAFFASPEIARRVTSETERATLTNVLLSLQNATEKVEFAEADGTKVQLSQADALMRTIAARPPVVEFAERVTAGAAPEHQTEVDAAKAAAKKFSER
ncbi:MAG: hypothetical protein HY962_07110 [Ignavibacteriae bacterium]|nr:hypothetical protein [Ignavibacteriota bacterium]